jgi:DNA-binding transcriptional ArsR family regulator
MRESMVNCRRDGFANSLTYKRSLIRLLDVTDAADAVFRALADPTRREMLELLREGERTVLELAEPFRMSQPAISQHLAVLRDSGLVSFRRDGRNRIYRIEPKKLQTVDDWLAHYRHFWTGKLWALGEYLDEEEKKKPKKR